MKGYLEDLKAGGRPMTDKELAEHYKHLYNEVKKQKDDVVKFIKEKGLKEEEWQNGFCIKATATYTRDEIFGLLRMLGEKDEI